MAPRKKSSSKQPNVGAWLGGNKGYVLSGSNTDTSAKVDSGGGQMEAVRGELGLGAYAAGIGATAAIGAGIAAVKSGRVINPVAATRNLVKGEKIVVHGTSAKIKGSQLVPKSGSRGSETIGKPVVFGHNPRAVGASKSLYQESITYANKNAEYGNFGQIIVGSAKKKDLKRVGNVLDTAGPNAVLPDNPTTRKYLYSEKPIKIKKVVEPVQKTYPGTSKQYTTFDPKTLKRELRKEGVLLRRPSVAEQAEDVRKAAAKKIREAKYRRRLKDDSDF